jgi:hypothetical protein
VTVIVIVLHNVTSDEIKERLTAGDIAFYANQIDASKKITVK